MSRDDPLPPKRLAGLETEYAIRFTPAHEDAELPSNALIYTVLMRAVNVRVKMVGKKPLKEVVEGTSDGRVFVENGGAFNYEVLSKAPGGGLLEGATPECRSAGQLVLYQAAQDRLLEEALPRAEQMLAFQGYEGSIGLLKNCRDGFDHLYGAQENYEVDVATGWRFLLFRVAFVLLVPWIVVWGIGAWLLLVAWLLVFFLIAIPTLLVVALLLSWTGRLETTAPWIAELFSGTAPFVRGRESKRWHRVLYLVEVGVTEAAVLPLGWLAHALFFAPLRRRALAFFASRAVFTGAGSVRPDGTFHLSEKALGVSRIVRRSVWPDARGIFEASALLKSPGKLIRFDLRGFTRAFRKRQRVQVGLSDSNLAQTAELLKVGTARVVLDLLDAGALDDAPRLADPIAAMHAITSDPTLKTAVRLKNGDTMTALEIQRFYLSRAEEHAAASSVADLETNEILRLWGEALDALETHPGTLVGRVDWVTKRFLLERHEDATVRKKVDLKYHELVDGYFRRLEAEGVAPRVTAPDDVERAMRNPPDDTPAFVRSRWIRRLSDATAPVEVDWDSIRIGGRVRGRVVRLVDPPEE